MLRVDIVKNLPAVSIKALFDIQTTGITVFFGPSGAGKSSIVNMLAGLMTPDKGHIEINGRKLYDSANRINLPPNKRNMGYVFQDSRLFPHMTVIKNLFYGVKNKQEAKNQIETVSKLLGIDNLLDRYPARLSGGEKQRVAIGRALLSNPEILLMDEPMASLDGPRRNELMEYIAMLPGEFNIPVVYVTHTMEEILRLADNVGLMHKGELVDFGRTAEVLNSSKARDMVASKDFGVVWEGTVIADGGESGLGVIEFGGGRIEVATGGLTVGARVRFKIPALDIVLSRQQPDTVARNCFKGIIEEIIVHDNLADVKLDIGVPLWARVTAQSCRDMNMQVGNPMHAIVKSVVASSQFFLINSKPSLV